MAVIYGLISLGLCKDLLHILLSDDQMRSGRVLVDHSVIHDLSKIVGIQQGVLILIGIKTLSHLGLGSGGRNAHRIDPVFCPAFGCHQHRRLGSAVFAPCSMGLQGCRRTYIDDLQIGIVFESQLCAIDGTGEIDVNMLFCVLQICLFDGAGNHIASIIDQNIGNEFLHGLINAVLIRYIHFMAGRCVNIVALGFQQRLNGLSDIAAATCN